MAYSNILKQKLSPDLKGLIGHITGYQENSPEFKKYEDLIWSNILHRSYPSISRHRTREIVDDFVEKFKVHGFPQKGKNLKLLVDHYAQLDYFKDSIEGEDNKWGILDLLIKLSYKPTNCLEDDKPIKVPLIERKEIEAPFDWGAYLKEGSEKFHVPSYSDEDSPWDLSDEDPVEDTLALSPVEMEEAESLPELRGEGDGAEEEESEEDGLNIKEAISALTSQEYLEEHVQMGWWDNPNLRELPPSKHPSANYCFIWEKAASKIPGSGIKVGETRVISEFKVLRELIWVLNRPACCYIIDKIGDQFKVREKMSICSLSPLMFQHFINSEVCSFLPMIVELNSFRDKISPMDQMSSQLPLTYLAYSTALGEIMNTYVSKLCDMEVIILKQEQTVTLTSLLCEIRPWLRRIRFLYQLHKKAVFDDWLNTDNWICSARLLEVLFNHLIDVNEWNILTVLGLFLKSFSPYMNIIGTWLTEAKLMDFKNEFVITRPDDNPEEGHLIVRNYKEVLCELGIESSFLESIVGVCYRAGASIDFLVLLEKADSVRMEGLHFDMVFKHFIETLEAHLLDCTIEKKKFENSKVVEEEPPPAELTVPKPTYDLPNKKLFTATPTFPHSSDFFILAGSLMEDAFEFYRHPPSTMKTKGICDKLLEKLEERDLCTTPIMIIVKRTAFDSIEKFMRPKGFAKQILLEEYKLLEHLESLRKVYFFQAGGVMNMFTSQLFAQMAQEDLRITPWTLLLREYISMDIPKLASKFSVAILPRTSNLYMSGLNYIKHIEIRYEADSPLDLIITKSIISSYNVLFQFFLQIKLSLYTLQKLNFKDFQKDESVLIRRLFSVRMWLLHTISTLHRYFITVRSAHFEQSILTLCSRARDLHKITAAHEDILESWKSYCFLSDSHPCKDSVQKLLILCLRLELLWNLGVKNILVVHQVTELENEYEATVKELAEMLNTISSTERSDSFRMLYDEIINNIPSKED